MSDTQIRGGWKPDTSTGIILDLDQHEGVNSPDHRRLMISSQVAGDRLVAWLIGHGYGRSPSEHVLRTYPITVESDQSTRGQPINAPDLHLQNHEEGRYLKASLQLIAGKRDAEVSHISDEYQLSTERKARIDEYVADLVRRLRNQQ